MLSKWAYCIAFGAALGPAASGCEAAERSPDSDADDAAAKAAPLEPAEERTTLIDASGWQVMAAGDDPFSDRPGDAACPDEAHMAEFLAEELVFSVDTGGCTYLTARQPVLRHVAAGETVVLRVWHFALNAAESAEAHVAVRLGDETLLDTSVAIPSAGGLLRVARVAKRAVAAGTAAYFHLHNHGDNSWSFVELSTGPAE